MSRIDPVNQCDCQGTPPFRRNFAPQEGCFQESDSPHERHGGGRAAGGIPSVPVDAASGVCCDVTWATKTGPENSGRAPASLVMLVRRVTLRPPCPNACNDSQLEKRVVTSEPVIQVAGLKKTYRSGILGRRRLHALQGVDLEVPKGSIYGLLGPNGAGKTTLIKILLGIVRKSDGGATVLGQPAGRLAARRRIGYLPENHRIPRHLTGRTALEYYGALSGLSVGEIRRRMPELLDRVGLAGREKESVAGYSKGMQQRLGLAQAMLHQPDLIVLDEPTDGVDPVGRKEIREVLRSLADEGATIFLNSHLLQEIELVCERVAAVCRN